jgi:hypothetical protein
LTTFQLVYHNKIRFAEVQFFFQVSLGGRSESDTHAVALVCMYSEPDVEILQRSHQVLQVCEHQTQDVGLIVVDAKTIIEVVGMIPFKRHISRANATNPEFFVLEKMSFAYILGEEESGDDPGLDSTDD